MVNVQKREIFDLVAEGWNSETLHKMSIAERRFYYNMLIKKYDPDNKPRNQNPKSTKKK